MKKFMTIALAFVMVLGLTSFAMAGWDKCKGCHTDSGKPAYSKATLLKKFKTADALIKAAQRSKHPMMENYKNEDDLKAAAKDLGLK